jgi:16S rRNA (adenine1518-N6/adenine1519-N6)-dimethyltransferase
VHGQPSRARLRALGLRPNKRLSQSFLEDQATVRAIVAAARLDATQDVLEVGPGLGILTEHLAGVARRVVAVEIDAKLAEGLRAEFGEGNVSITTDDILNIDPARFFDEPYVVVANLPYHITSPALRHLLAAGPPFATRLAVMVQAEVADRIAARQGQLSALAVGLQVQARVRHVRRVPATAFFPQPEVDSAVLVLDAIADEDRLVGRGDVPAFVQLVQAGFKQPRKKLVNSLGEGLGDRVRARELIAEAGIDPARRPQELAVDEWVRLFGGQA